MCRYYEVEAMNVTHTSCELNFTNFLGTATIAVYSTLHVVVYLMLNFNLCSISQDYNYGRSMGNAVMLVWNMMLAIE